MRELQELIIRICKSEDAYERNKADFGPYDLVFIRHQDGTTSIPNLDVGGYQHWNYMK